MRTDLVLGAVNWSATVWVNGREAGAHEGGFTPFRLDITDLLRPGANTVTVRADNPSDRDDQILIGKMGGSWYTRSSGIWQSVYLEARPRAFVRWAHVVPDPSLASASVRVRIESSEGEGIFHLALVARGPGGDAFRASWTGWVPAGSSDVEVPLAMPGAEPWSPERPVLYTLDLTLQGPDGPADQVEATFGLRTVRADWIPGHGPADTPDPSEQYQGILINGRPLYLRGALDQGFNPLGLLAYPSAQAAEADVDTARSLGLNALRIHGKLEDPLLLEEADRRGVVLLVDLPFPTLAAANAAGARLRTYVEEAFDGALERDWNHPSILSWTLFNEGWGLRRPLPLESNPEMQGWLRGFVGRARAADPTRLIEDNSAGGAAPFHLDSDLDTWHDYSEDPAEIRKWSTDLSAVTFPGSTSGPEGLGGWLAPRRGAPLLVSEFGGFDGMGIRHDVSRALRTWVNEIRRQPKIQGWILTELYDVEWEGNGLLHYDRSPKGFPWSVGPALGPAYDLGGDAFLGFEEPMEELVPRGASVTTTPFLSLVRDPPPGSWSLSGPSGTVSLPSLHRGFNELPAVPSTPATDTIPFEVIDPSGNPVAWNLRRAALALPAPPLAGWLAAATWPVDSCLQGRWTEGGPFPDPEGRSVAGYGTGFTECRVPAPALAGPATLTVGIELAAAAPLPPLQTDPLGPSSLLRLTLNGVASQGPPLSLRAPADASGLYSWLLSPSLLGAYGTLVVASFDLPSTPPPGAPLVLHLEVPAGAGGPAHGLRIFGSGSGRWGLDPTLLTAAGPP